MRVAEMRGLFAAHHTTAEYNEPMSETSGSNRTWTGGMTPLRSASAATSTTSKRNAQKKNTASSRSRPRACSKRSSGKAEMRSPVDAGAPAGIRVTISRVRSVVSFRGSMRLIGTLMTRAPAEVQHDGVAVSYTHLRAHETPEQLVCRLLLEKKKKK